MPNLVTLAASATNLLRRLDGRAREKKIVENFPKTTKDELEKLSNQMRNQGVSRNTDINKNNYLTAKTTYHTSLYSNIFNDPVNN